KMQRDRFAIATAIPDRRTFASCRRFAPGGRAQPLRPEFQAKARRFRDLRSGFDKDASCLRGADDRPGVRVAAAGGEACGTQERLVVDTGRTTKRRLTQSERARLVEHDRSA